MIFAMNTECVWRDGKYWTLKHGDGEIFHVVRWCGRYLKWQVSTGNSLLIPRGLRSNVTAFSDPSRLAMLSAFSRVNWPAATPCSLITLTYPDSIPCQDNSLTNLHRAVFWRYLERHVGRPIAAFWRIERLPRQSGLRVFSDYPHFHLLAFAIPYIHYLHINHWWQCAINHDEFVHTDIRAAANAKIAGSYISKYVAKKTCSLGITINLNTKSHGRHWGILRKSHVPWCENKEIRMIDCKLSDRGQARALEDRPQLNKWGGQSFTLLGDLAEAVGGLVFGSGLDV